MMNILRWRNNKYTWVFNIFYYYLTLIYKTKIWNYLLIYLNLILNIFHQFIENLLEIQKLIIYLNDPLLKCLLKSSIKWPRNIKTSDFNQLN